MTEAEELELLELEELEAQSAAPKAEPSQLRAGAVGATQGLTLGFGDEIGAGIGQFFLGGSGVKPGAAAAPSLDDSPEVAEIKAKLNAPQPSDYELLRDGMRGEAKALEEAHPATFGGAQLAGGIATSFIPAGAVMKGTGMLAKGARAIASPVGQGALNSFGNAEGTAGEQALQTAGGAALGKVADKAIGGVANKLGNNVRKFVGGERKFDGLAGWFRGKAADAAEDKVAAATGKVDKAIRSSQGSYRGKVGEASRDLEVLEREAREGVGEVADKARAYLQTPEAKALKDMVLENKLLSAPERIADVSALKNEFGELAAGRGDDIANEIAEKSANPIKSVVTPRLKAHLVNKGLPVAATAAGSTVGNMLGGEDHDTLGTALGGGVGFGLSLFGGNPGTVIKNVAKNPYLREYVAKGGQKVAEGAGTLVDGLTRPAILEATDDVDEKYRALAEFLNRSRRE